MHFSRGDNMLQNRPSAMGMCSDMSGSNFHHQMGNMQRPNNTNHNHMNQMNYMNQQRHNVNQQMSNHPSSQQMSHQQQQMHQMQQHQRMLNHQRMMMMNAALHHNNSSHSQLMRPSGPNMSKIFLSMIRMQIKKIHFNISNLLCSL